MLELNKYNYFILNLITVSLWLIYMLKVNSLSQILYRKNRNYINQIEFYEKLQDVWCVSIWKSLIENVIKIEQYETAKNSIRSLADILLHL